MNRSSDFILACAMTVLILICAFGGAILKLHADDLVVRQGVLATPEPSWGKLFSDPYETVVFIFADRSWMSFSNQDDRGITTPAWRIAETIVRGGHAITDIVYCVHNHALPGPFTRPDAEFYAELAGRGFRGVFGIYYTATRRLRRWGE